MIRVPSSNHTPIIVVGMHRSGTSMLSRLLTQMGVFMGADCSLNHAESRTFLRLNVRVLRLAEATWYSPAPMMHALANSSHCERLLHQLRREFNARCVRRYLGTESMEGGSGRDPFPAFWGWKDPRNTLAFPLWYQHFPQAKIIHITRNGIDVAHSLVRREQVNRPSRRLMLLKVASNIRQRLSPEYKPKPFRDLQEAFDLWAEYVGFANESLASRRPKELLELRYEDLLLKPAVQLQRVADFLRLGLTQSELSSIAASIDADRRYAFAENPRLRAFYEACQGHPLMVRFGYDADSLRLESPGLCKSLRAA